MEHEDQMSLARQLRCPTGEVGLVVGARMNVINGMMNRAALELLEAGSSDRVLEIGFGGASLMRAILLRGSLAAGVDLSLTMAREARRRIGPPARVCRGSVQTLPYRDGSFTKIVTVNTVYFWDDLRHAFSECRRVLRPDGKLVVCFNADYELRKESWDHFRFTLYGMEEVADSLRSAGFTLIESRLIRDPEQGDFFCLSAASALDRLDGVQ